MDQLDALRAFVLAVDRGSLSAAARAMGRSSASLTRAIDALETRVGTALLRRTTRSLKLTEAGERYLGVVRRVVAELDDAEKAAGTVTAEPQGVLTVTAPVAFGTLHVRPLLDAFVTAHANVRGRLLLLDRFVNLLDEGVDVAVRIGHLADSALLATAVGTVRRVLVATPRYLARHGQPKRPEDLARHRCIASTALTPLESWPFGGGKGARTRRIRVEPLMSVNVAGSAIRSALDDVGLTCALSYQVAEELESGSLVRLLPRFEPPPVPVHLVYPAASARAAKVRAFVELATPRLRARFG